MGTTGTDGVVLTVAITGPGTVAGTAGPRAATVDGIGGLIGLTGGLCILALGLIVPGIVGIGGLKGAV